MAITVWEFWRLTSVLNCLQWETTGFPHLLTDWKLVVPIWLQWTIQIWTGLSFTAPVMFNLSCTVSFKTSLFWGGLTFKIIVIHGSRELEGDIHATPRLLVDRSQGCPGRCLTFRILYRGIRHQTAPHVVYGMGQEVLFWKIEKSQKITSFEALYP